MSRRCSSAQALDAYVIIKDSLEHPDYCINEYDCETTTKRKLEKLAKIKDALNIVASFIDNPDRTSNT